MISPHTVRRVRMSFRKSNVRKLVENCVEATDCGDDTCDALSDVNFSISELLLFRWALSVCDYVEAESRTLPQQQKVPALVAEDRFSIAKSRLHRPDSPATSLSNAKAEGALKH